MLEHPSQEWFALGILRRDGSKRFSYAQLSVTSFEIKRHSTHFSDVCVYFGDRRGLSAYQTTKLDAENWTDDTYQRSNRFQFHFRSRNDGELSIERET